MRCLNEICFRHALLEATDVATDRWRKLRSALLLIVSVMLFGCGERPPQYQLIPAVLRGDAAKVEMLLTDTANVDVNWQAGGKGESALSAASAQNEVEIVRLLLRYGAAPNIATDKNETPLLSASYHGHVEVVRLLLEAGADVNAVETMNGYSPLASAAFKGHADVVRLLLQNGADRNTKISDGRTPYDLAYGFGHVDVLAVFESTANSFKSLSDKDGDQ